MKLQIAGKLSAIAIIIALTATPFVASAGQFRGAGAMQATGMGVNLIDTDGDGVGDTRPEPGTGTGMNSTNFVDSDGDGVCDLYVEGSSQLLDGSGDKVAYRGGRQ